ncbi:alpha-2-macroglobulin family protein [Lichenicola cladoniae]|uniref:Alpha-2-macroglobulin family protein n=1 Tax=Lichenicola cladoniae TaxID=1484109 RepID=A0A6M8HHB8_9PROT|nr:MG2 domain-containing protein [Lichenicola cladoniae]NPD69640.1 alpha-2-macroglobulin family protein [Acetobacteraceae bacterium]QKE88709.1 alpha-2-macroglobulin family protein [Lichenicola cladoniae]
MIRRLLGLFLMFAVSSAVGQTVISSRHPAAAQVAEDKGGAPPAPAPVTPDALEFQRLLLNTGGNNAEACLRFGAKLDDRKAADYAARLSLVPAAKPSVRIEGSDLCIGGLGFGTRHALTVSAGLVGAQGERLRTDLHLTVTLADRPATVAIAGDGYVLPRTTATGIEIQTVNVKRVRLRVLRMSQQHAVARTGSESGYGNDPVNLSTTSMHGYELDALLQSDLVPIWQGMMDVDGDPNKTVVTAFPVAGVIHDQRAGLYLVTAEDGDAPASRLATRPDIAAHWVNVSDIGLSTIEGRDGLHVVARSLATALPMQGVRIALNAHGGDVLGVAVTDRDGSASFAPGLVRGKGPEAPDTIVATGLSNDFASIRLGTWFDFSDRGAEGHAVAGPEQAIVMTERGVYRPGEMVQTTSLLRNHLGAAIGDQPLVLELDRPDGIEERRMTLPAAAEGGFVVPVPLTGSAPLGTWTLRAYADPTSPSIGSATFEVQDFVPQVLGVELVADQPALLPGSTASATLTGRFLYGAPAAGLHGDGSMRVLVDPSPVPGVTGYAFGLASETLPGKEQKLEVPDADALGKSKIAVSPTVPAGLSLPMTISVEAGMQDPGGRSVTKRIMIPVRRTRPLIGLKGHDAGGDAVQQTAKVEIATFDPEGKPVAVPHMAWRVIRENDVYDWFGGAGGWSFHQTTIDEPISQGTVDTGSDGRATIAPMLDQARYRIVVTDTASGAVTSTEVHVGWWAPEQTDAAPDRLDVVAKDSTIPAGGSTVIHVASRFAGEAQVTIAGDRVFSTRTIHIPAGGTDIPVTADPGWEGGAYALVTLYRPLKQPARPHDPVRAVGLAWIGLDEASHRLDVSMQAPDLALPRQQLHLPVSVRGAGASGHAHLTLAAVDEGVLGITSYKQADPFDLLFGKHRLGIDTTDTYSHLLDGSARAGRIREGGDEGSGPTGLAVTSTRVVSLFSGDVLLDAMGRGVVTLDVPDFEGRLRLMATAWSADGVGSATGGTTIRDPVIPDVSLPRFLAPGDTARDTVSIADTDGADGTYELALAATGSVRIDGASTFKTDLRRGQRREFAIGLAGTTAGIGRVVATLTGPGLHRHPLVRDWSIEVRPAHLPTTTSTIVTQAPGKSYRADPTLLAGYDPGSTTMTIGYSGFGGIDTIGLLQSLEVGGWGSSEDLAAQAWPLIHFRQPGLMGRLPIPGGATGRVQTAVDTLLDREDAGGRIGEWHLNDGGTLPWTQIYLVDFLGRAKEAGFSVSRPALDRALDWLEESQLQGGVRQSDDDAVTPATRAYALFVLARAGRLDAGAIRTMHDDLASGLGNDRTMFVWGSPGAEATIAEPLALGHMSAALALADQHDASREGFGWAVANLGPARVGPPQLLDGAYWIYVRDLAGVTALAADARDDELAQRLVQQFNLMDLSPPQLNDQEKAGLLGVAAAMDRDDPAVRIAVNGKEVADPVHLPQAFTPDTDDIAKGYTVSNTGTRPLWLTTTVTGTPTQAPPATDTGYSVRAEALTMSGDRFDTRHLRQNDRFIVLVSGSADGGDVHRTILVSMLPAGWEIESTITDGQDGFDFLGELTHAKSEQAQDDRFVAIFGTDPDKARDTGVSKSLGQNEYRLAYVVRAVTPGSFILPETVVTDRYRPTITGRTAASRTEVAPR